MIILNALHANKRVFKISIPRPCSENWEAMKKKGEGRFCENCKKIVVDFSHLTNEELYFHFSRSATIPCGRFNNAQLETNLYPQKKQGFWKQLYKPIAATIAFLLFKGSEASVIKRPDITVQPSNKKKASPVFNNKVTISGSVKDADGDELEDAEILFDQKLITKTGKDGKFQFEFEIEDVSKFHLLQISYPGMVTIVRNYHPAMESTSFNVVLEKPGVSYCHTMGIPAIPFLGAYVNFGKGKSQLTTESKTDLSELATKMRSNPDVSVSVTAYAGSAAEIALAKNRQTAIKNYLVEQEGISPDRFKMKLKAKTAEMQNIIEISATEREYD